MYHFCQTHGSYLPTKPKIKANLTALLQHPFAKKILKSLFRQGRQHIQPSKASDRQPPRSLQGLQILTGVIIRYSRYMTRLWCFDGLTSAVLLFTKCSHLNFISDFVLDILLNNFEKIYQVYISFYVKFYQWFNVVSICHLYQGTKGTYRYRSQNFGMATTLVWHETE